MIIILIIIIIIIILILTLIIMIMMITMVIIINNNNNNYPKNLVEILNPNTRTCLQASLELGWKDTRALADPHALKQEIHAHERAQTCTALQLLL